MPRDDDDLVYDGRFGWIDPRPEHFLASIGVDVRETTNALVYRVDRFGYRHTLTILKDADWPVLRAIVDDAEYRCTGRVSS